MKNFIRFKIPDEITTPATIVVIKSKSTMLNSECFDINVELLGF